MLTKTRDRSKPTFYLDNSVLCDAFRAHDSRTRKPSLSYASLFPWIQRVAHEANLCLSIFHIAELSAWKDLNEAEAVVHWYDQLPIVWVKSIEDVFAAETEYWTYTAVGIACASEVEPFEPSLLSALSNVSVPSMSRMLQSRSPLLDILFEFRRLHDDAKIPSLVPFADVFREDRAFVREQGWTEEYKKLVLARNTRVAIRRAVADIQSRILAGGARSPSELKVVDGTAQDRLVELFERDPKVLPAFRTSSRFLEGMASSAAQKKAGSKNNQTSFSGSFADYVHAIVGASYCDVFTCDKATSEWLGDQRPLLGHRLQQMSPGKHLGDIRGFVAELMSTWP